MSFSYQSRRSRTRRSDASLGVMLRPEQLFFELYTSVTSPICSSALSGALSDGWACVCFTDFLLQRRMGLVRVPIPL